MAGTKSTALRNSQADNLVANLDTMEIIDSTGPTTLVTYTGVTWNAASSGQVSLGATLSDSASAGGTADTAKLYHSGASGEEITSLTVTGTGGGGDVELDNTSINSGQTVEITSGTITEPSSTA